MVDDIHVVDLIPAYVLDCLETDEARQVAEHLGACPRCRAELAAYQAVADQLPLAAPVVAPPPGLKRQLMRKIEPKPPAKATGLENFWRSLAGLLRKSASVWGLASLVLVLVFGASTLVLWQQLSVRERAVELANMRLVALKGTEAAPQASGVLVMSVDGNEGTLVVDDLPLLDEAHQYQLWLIRADQQRISGGVFSVNSRGYGAMWVSAPERLTSFPAFGITVEPAGGSPGPTGERVLGSTF